MSVGRRWSGQVISGEWVILSTTTRAESASLLAEGTGERDQYVLSLSEANPFFDCHRHVRFAGENAARTVAVCVQGTDDHAGLGTKRPIWDAIHRGGVMDIGIARTLLGLAGEHVPSQDGHANALSVSEVTGFYDRLTNVCRRHGGFGESGGWDLLGVGLQVAAHVVLEVTRTRGLRFPTGTLSSVRDEANTFAAISQTHARARKNLHWVPDRFRNGHPVLNKRASRELSGWLDNLRHGLEDGRGLALDQLLTDRDGVRGNLVPRQALFLG